MWFPQAIQESLPVTSSGTVEIPMNAVGPTTVAFRRAMDLSKTQWNMRAIEPRTLFGFVRNSLVFSLTCLSAFAALIGCSKKEDGFDCDASPSVLYDKRVRPLLTSDRLSSCSQCHAGGIELADVLRPDPCESIACLKADGLVDLEHPERSVLLRWIERAEPQSELITKEVISEEKEAFLSWFEHEAACENCEKSECSSRTASDCEQQDPLEGSYNRNNDPGDCDRETIEKLFRGTVYDWRGRCSPCHFQEEKEATKAAPRWLSRTGSCNVAALASLTNIEEMGYIDPSDPLKSPLLRKPLAEFNGGLPHKGHDKLTESNDPAYDAFAHFLKRYVACNHDE